MDDIVEFFRPTFFKLNLALVSLTLIGYLFWPIIASFAGVETITFGLPVATRSLVMGSGVPDDIGNLGRISLPAVSINLIFWYIASCTYVSRFGEWEFGNNDPK